MDTELWIAVLQIVAIDILLEGDNAVVIAWSAAACRKSSARRALSGTWPVPSDCGSC
jgi:predicted tellurium resistance membrane protein TerC